MREGSGSRRWLLLGMGLGLAVVVAAAVVVFVVLDGRDDRDSTLTTQTTGPTRPTGDPDEAPVPEADVASQTLDYLAGAGAPALTMHRAAADLGASPTEERCQQVGSTLDREAPPDRMVLVIQGVQDEVLRVSLTSEQGALGDTLTACAQGKQPTDERTAPLPEAVQLVQARLDELEALR